MTAFNLIVQPQAAYLITDTAQYLDDGTIHRFGPKTLELHFGQMVGGEPCRAVMAFQGCIGPDTFAQVLSAYPVPDLTTFLKELPALVRGVSQAIPAASRLKGTGADNSILTAIAIWDQATATPYGFLIGNESSEPVRAGHMPPFTVVRMRHYILQRASPADHIDYADPLQFNPAHDGGALLDDQRADLFGDDELQFVGVGGSGTLTTVGPNGTSYSILRQWPDKLGERIPL